MREVRQKYRRDRTKGTGAIRRKISGGYRICNSTPLLPRVLSQHSVVSICIVANVSIIIIVRILISFGESTRVLMGVSTHINAALRTEMAVVVAALTLAMSAD